MLPKATTNTITTRVGVTEAIVRATFSSLKGIHQREGVRWMCRRETHPGSVPSVRGGCVADGMGLGKTFEVCALLRLRPLPTLVVVPLSTLMQWQSALTTHGRGLPFVLRGRAQADNLGLGGFESTHTVLTTYSLFQRGIDGVPDVLRRPWGRVVLDEAHIIRNPKSNAHMALRKVGEHSVHRWVLTGTPVNNNIRDLNSLVAWLGAPGLSIALVKEHLMLHRTLEEEAARSPEFRMFGVSVHDCIVEMGEDERELYNLIEASGRSHALGNIEGCRAVGDALFDVPLHQNGCLSHFRAMEAVLRCRQACTHPGLLREAVAVAARPDSNTDESSLREAMRDPRVIIEACRQPLAITFSSKMRRLVQLVSCHRDEKTLIFCDWIQEMDIVQEALTSCGAAVDVVRYQGCMDLRERERALRSFTSMGQGAVLIAQIQCGGTGLNIQSASRVYLMRPAWNPCVEQQAISRAHRLGQTRHVTVTRLISADSIDVRCLEIQSKKLTVIDSVMCPRHSTLGSKEARMLLSPCSHPSVQQPEASHAPKRPCLDSSSSSLPVLAS